MHVAAGLHHEPGARRVDQIRRHDGRRPAQKGERGLLHPGVAHRHQPLHRVAAWALSTAMRGSRPCEGSGSRQWDSRGHPIAQLLAGGEALFDGETGAVKCISIAWDFDGLAIFLAPDTVP